MYRFEELSRPGDSRLEEEFPMTEYAHPEVLVTTDWVADHLNDPKIRLIEVDFDTSAYNRGHIPDAVDWN